MAEGAGAFAVGPQEGTTIQGPVVRGRDAHLDEFTDLAREELIETLALACRVGKIARVLTGARVAGRTGAGPKLDDRYATAPVETLASILDESYLGGG